MLTENDLIDTAGIASLLGLTREYVTDELTKKAGFPRPRINLSRRLRKWDRDEVVAYITKPKGRRR